MPRVIFFEHGGQRHEVEVDAGVSVMRAAVDFDVPGIDADCGGQCACATCHVYLLGDWPQRAGEPAAVEKTMLEFTASQQPSSRLACQILMSDALDGIEVQMPDGQH